MKRFLAILLVAIMVLSFAGCGCEHVFDDGVILEESTCQKEGTKQYECIECGKTKTETLEVIECDYKEEEIVKNATCQEEGLKIYYCSMCGKEKEETIEIVSCAYKKEVTEATYEQPGEIVYTCEMCGDTYTEVIPQKQYRVKVEVTDKISLAPSYSANRYIERVNFNFILENFTEKDVKGLKGTLMIYDMFGNFKISVGCNFTGKIIKVGKTAKFSNMGMDISRFDDEEWWLYNEAYEDLVFEYQIERIVFTDGTTENG